ncbi:MAG: helix-turn-helix transcriptional regulator [Deltaproteobacteria bacterium]|nr:helix-turn-helix transcriptional regulator [Deltaproteobacteria bacterium]
MGSDNAFPARLLAARNKRGLSQDELANRAKLQPSAVSHFETGTRKPSFDNLKRLADALEVTVDYLMGRTNTPGAILMEGDELFRHFENLTADDREIARDFMASLAKRREQQKGSKS